MTVSFVCSHRRDVDDVVAGDETEHEEETDEKLSSSRYWCRGSEDDYPPTIVESGSEPCHVLDHVLSLEDRVRLRCALGRRETHLHAAGIIDGPYFCYLGSGDRECSLEL